jgi:hypothetical protein
VILSWCKSPEGHWFPLATMDLRIAQTTGVYVIWEGGARPRTVRVGVGRIIADCLYLERYDPRVLEHSRRTTLYVTWAAVSPERLEGVEYFLDSLLRPLVRFRLPNCLPTPVNLPAALR